MQREAVHAVADLGGGIRDVLGVQTPVDRPPRLAAVVAAERARGRDRDVDALRVTRIEQDGVEAHAAGPRLPLRPGAVAAQPGELLPRLPAVVRAKQPGVFHPGVDRVRIGEGRLEMPDALELPGMLRAVVPLVRGERLAGLRRDVVDELVALALGTLAGFHRHAAAGRVPRLGAVARALDDLAEPAARLRRVQPIAVDARSLQVIDLPAGEVRAAHVPAAALAVRGQNERTLAGADQYAYTAHVEFTLRLWPSCCNPATAAPSSRGRAWPSPPRRRHTPTRDTVAPS